MHRNLLDVLADPETGQPLSLVDDDGRDPIEEGTLTSGGGRTYQIVRGVPRLVPGEDYGSSFGLQWNRFARVQLDSANGAGYSRRRFDSETGWAAEELAGKWLVDIGCGSGRFAEIAAGYGAEVIAVDLSSAVDAAQRNLGHLPNVHVVQADLRHLPVRRDAIDRLYCLGVLQHTPDPLASARALVEALPPGGRFAFTIYGRGPLTKVNTKYLVRPLTRRIGPERLLAATERAMPVLFPLTSFLYALPVVGRAFSFAIPVANYVDRTDLSRDARYQEAILDTFDMLSPRYDHPVTADEVTATLAGLCEQIDVASARPVVVRGTRITNPRAGGTPPA